jgi:SnoaL-like domain
MLDSESAARAVIDIFATGDVDAIRSSIAEEYVDHQGLNGVEIRAQQGFRQVVRAVQTRAGVRVGIQDIVAAGDKAAIRIGWQYRNDADRLVTRETPAPVRGRPASGALGSAALVRGDVTTSSARVQIMSPGARGGRYSPFGLTVRSINPDETAMPTRTASRSGSPNR